MYPAKLNIEFVHGSTSVMHLDYMNQLKTTSEQAWCPLPL